MLIHQMGFDVTGIDVSSNAVEIAKATCRSDGLRFYAADSVPESFPENTFDIVVMLNILHCVSNDT